MIINKLADGRFHVVRRVFIGGAEFIRSIIVDAENPNEASRKVREAT